MMMKFDEFRQLYREKFVCVEYTDETQDRLRKWCEDHGFDLTYNFDGTRQTADEFDFHTTIIFSNTPTLTLNGMRLIEPFEVNPIGFEILGVDREIPVLRVESPTLLSLRDECESQGMADAWPEYKAHVSLSYAPTLKGSTPVSEMTLPDFPLIADRVHVKDAIH